MSKLFEHRDPIGTGTYPLPQGKYFSQNIIDEIKQSKIIGKKETVFYIHIPFCKKFCSYCGIFKFSYDKDKVDQYVQALTEEIDSYFKNFSERELATVYFGGGTPTLLSKNNWLDIFAKLNKFKKTNDYEMTVEGTPDGFTEEMLLFLKDQGVNRISIGVQTFSGETNNEMSRFYQLNNLKKIVDIGIFLIGNVNIDLIYNLPNQSRETFYKDLTYINSLNITHITINPFVVIVDAPIYEKIINGIVPRPSEGMEVELFKEAIDILSEMKFAQYAVRDFCKEGKKCQYIIRTAYCYDVIGIGFGSYGFLNGVTYRNCFESIDEYTKSIRQSGFSFSSMHKLSEGDFLDRIMVQGLRLMDFSFSKAEKLHQKSIRSVFSEKLDKIKSSSLGNIENDIMKYTKEGLIYANNIRGMFAKNINYLGFGLSSIGKSKRGNYE